MTNKTKYIGGPKSKETKAISSRNSTTHGLTAKNWINDDEQELFDVTLEALDNDFDPQSHIEEMLIAKLAECTVRLSRIQRVEDAMFDLASSEATHPDLSITSLSNNNEDLSHAVKDTSPIKLQFNANEFAKKMGLLDEIKSQNLDDISNWSYIENNMQCTTQHVIQECLDNNIRLHNLITKESSQSNVMEIILVSAGDKDTVEENANDPTLTASEITESSKDIKSSDLHKYLDRLSQTLIKDLQVQTVLKDLDRRIQQIKNSAIPDAQKLSLVQRYRTADERLFSKSLGELIALQDRRKNI